MLAYGKQSLHSLLLLALYNNQIDFAPAFQKNTNILKQFTASKMHFGLLALWCVISLCDPVCLTQWNERERGPAAGWAWHQSCRCRLIPDWVFRGCGWMDGGGLGGGGADGTVGRIVHTLRARPRGMCMCVCVCLAPGVCWQDVSWQHPSLTPLQLVPSGYPLHPLLSCSTTCYPSSFSLPGRRRGCPLLTFHLLLSFFLLSPPPWDWRCHCPNLTWSYSQRLKWKMYSQKYNWTIK